MRRLKSAIVFFFLLWLIALSACGHRPAVRTPSSVTDRIVIAYEGEEGKTALAILKSRAHVRTTTSQLGELVEEINGVNNGNGYYLIYFVNGTKANVGAGNYITKNGEKIEWRLIRH